MSKEKTDLELISELTAKALIRELSTDECSPSLISTAVRYLKDNGMTQEAALSGDLEALRALLDLEDEDLPYDEEDEEDGEDEE